MKLVLGAVALPLVIFAAQATGVAADEFSMQRIFEIIGSAGVIGVLTLWLFDVRRQMEAQRQMFLKELESERIAHETTRRMLIDMLKEQRPIYGSGPGQWNDRAHIPKKTGILEGD
jgi:hypothetical protein